MPGRTEGGASDKGTSRLVTETAEILFDGEEEGYGHMPGNAGTKFGLADLPFFFQFARPVWKLALFSLALAGAITTLTSILPMSGKVFVDFVLLNQGYAQAEGVLATVGLQRFAPVTFQYLSSVEFMLAALVVIAGTTGLLRLGRSYVTTRYEQEIALNLQKTVFERVLRYPMSMLRNTHSGYIVSRVAGDVYTLQFFFSNLITQALESGFQFTVGFGALYLLSPKITLVVLCIIPLYILVNLLFSRQIRRISGTQWESGARVSRDMQEILSGVEVVRTHTTEDREVEKVSRGLRKAMKARIRSDIFMTLSSSSMQAVQFALVLIVMWISAYEIRGGTMSIGDYVAFTAYVTLLAGSFSTIFSLYTMSQPMLASMDRLKELFAIVPEYEPGTAGSRKLTVPDKVSGTVRFDRVSFAYRPESPILADVSFTARPGEAVALTGPSGAGKTTLANLLLKFYAPQAGSITLDGLDIQALDTAWLRRQIAVVSQDIFLFDDTIAHNIRYGHPDLTQADVVAAAKQARIHDEIVKMPDGYDTLVGERGMKLSVGQRQRVSIARAFIKQTPLLIFDEPTSALDKDSETWVKESLRELVKDRTVLIISHHDTMLDVADSVVEINRRG